MTEYQRESTPSMPQEIFTRYRGFNVNLCHSLDAVATIWDQLGAQNIFLSSVYLKALHAAPPATMTFRYCMVWKDGVLCGIIYTQLDTFKAKKSISYRKDSQVYEPASGPFKQIRDYLAGRVRFRTLLCGNCLVTGEHGFVFIDVLKQEEQLELLDHILHALVARLKSEDIHVQLLFAKDFIEPTVRKLHMNAHTRIYHGFHAQPNMILQVDPAWKSFDGYLVALSSKYRVRARRAFKKAKRITKRELTIEDLIEHRDKIIEYYRDIAENASFNLFILNPDYFISVKKYLGDRFRVFGYFADDALLAFYSLMINGDEIEAHFLGYEEETNKTCQLYLNMLLDMIALSISLGIRRIIFGRTAMGIKSSVGAEPVEMYFYLQYQHALINPLVPFVYQTLEPEVHWIQRQPFKDPDDTP